MQLSCRAVQPSEYLPRRPCRLGAILAAIIFAMPLTAQEVLHPVKLRPGEVVRSISIRVTTGQPRFVVASRVVEEGESLSVPLEPPAEIVDYYERTATQQIEDIDRVCRLDERQKAKLKLAALGDMSRIARESREVREKHSGIAIRNLRDAKSAFDDVALVNVHLNEGVLRDGSMFLMVLKSLLTPEQTEQLAQANFGKLTLPWPVELSDVQRSQLWRLVMATNDRHTEPPILWEPNDCRLLVAQLPSSELAGFLNESQIDALQRWCRR
ncbi:MAG: hypothetical protein IT422_26535 [Pirellulaceae bacterium]|jgi:hypothetical protein|nr:hypothetical protein [Pirellulaceae bacterium]